MSTKRRLLAGVLTASISGAIGIVAAPVVSAATCPVGNYVWSMQWTAQSGHGGFYHPPTCPQDYAYHGWVGVDGEIFSPTHYPNLGTTPTQNHSAGWVNISFADTPNPITGLSSWVQEGWYAGCGGSFCRTSGVLGHYDEFYDAASNTYGFFDDGSLGFSSAIVYRIEYTLPSGCWYVYFNYSTFENDTCTLPGSGVPVVASEVFSIDGSVIEMPVTVYGNSNPNTNNGLRIKGAAGWVVWSATLSTGATSELDNSNQPVPYYLHTFNNHYYLKNYGQNTG